MSDQITINSSQADRIRFSDIDPLISGGIDLRLVAGDRLSLNSGGDIIIRLAETASAAAAQEVDTSGLWDKPTVLVNQSVQLAAGAATTVYDSAIPATGRIIVSIFGAGGQALGSAMAHAAGLRLSDDRNNAGISLIDASRLRGNQRNKFLFSLYTDSDNELVCWWDGAAATYQFVVEHIDDGSTIAAVGGSATVGTLPEIIENHYEGLFFSLKGLAVTIDRDADNNRRWVYEDFFIVLTEAAGAKVFTLRDSLNSEVQAVKRITRQNGQTQISYAAA